MDLLTTALAAIPAGGLLLAAALRARRFVQDGGAQAQTELIETYKGLNDALTQENASLRTDLAGCESENRGYRRRMRDE